MNRFHLLTVLYVIAVAVICLGVVLGLTKPAGAEPEAPPAQAAVIDDLGCAWTLATWLPPDTDGRRPVVLDLAYSAPDCVALYAEGAEADG